MLLMLSSIGYSQGGFKDYNLLSITIDGSRLIEDSKELDSGLDLAITLTMLRQFRVRPFAKFEVFPNLNYSKFAAGIEYAIQIEDIVELALGVEVGMISRKKPGAWAGFGYPTYGFDGDIRIFALSDKFPIIISWNEQWRTDMDIWDAEPKFVGSLFVGVGWSF